ncbi:hypothetical protein, partial [Caballeronia humi]|uniref:hypothetical protein n=1 Tax=Caballeronia humi TaxID=326474 RepID=UPI001F30898D
VKVGNRQAPHASNKNPTPKVGFLRFYTYARLLHEQKRRMKLSVPGETRPAGAAMRVSRRARKAASRCSACSTKN